MIRFLRIAWASPWSAVGCVVGLAAILTGGGVQVRCGVIEFYGGALVWILRHVPRGIEALALTLGHTVLGQTRSSLDRCRSHELVHVRQYERWGPLFVPAYFAAAGWTWLRGGDPYRDNPFEREAYSTAA